MLPSLVFLQHCNPIETSLPDDAVKLIEQEECGICLAELGEDSEYGKIQAGERKWVILCMGNHIVHKVCLGEQVQQIKTKPKCGECKRPVTDQAIKVAVDAFNNRNTQSVQRTQLQLKQIIFSLLDNNNEQSYQELLSSNQDIRDIIVKIRREWEALQQSDEQRQTTRTIWQNAKQRLRRAR